ncbi:hypothetical protein HDE_07745 [Halotydeus destructor]|nr:hypothetical protein HDE_07745 [Halotydeus destructor]
MNILIAALTLCFLQLVSCKYEVLDASCECFIGHSSKSNISASALLKDVFSPAPWPEVCNQKGVDDCKTHCTRLISRLSNGFTLGLPLRLPQKVDVDMDHSLLGQLLCNLIGVDVEGDSVRGEILFSCRQRPVDQVDTELVSDMRVSTGPSIQEFVEKLYCRDGIFKLIRQ